MWVEREYVNSSIDTVSHILYRQNGPALPDHVICQFPQYTGPPFLPELPFPVPIPSIQRVWTVNATTVFSRTGIPLSLTRAITVHKSQGLTLPQAVLDLGDSKMAAGLSFVAFSRVWTMADLILAPFPFERLSKLSESNQIGERLTEENCLPTLMHVN